MHSKTNMGKGNGFSLIEVIIVLLIISILAIAALPQIQRNLQLYRLESVTGLLSNRLTEARLTAVKHNRAAWLEINSTNNILEVWTTNEMNQPIRATLDNSGDFVRYRFNGVSFLFDRSTNCRERFASHTDFLCFGGCH